MKKDKNKLNNCIKLTEAEFKVSVYNKNQHIKLLADVFSKGGLPVDFCAAANIDKATLQLWLDAYPEFKHAYDILIVRSEVLWLNNVELAFQSFKYWHFVMRNIFGFGNLNTIDYAENAKDLDAILSDGLSEGRYTDEQIHLFLNIINIKLTAEKQGNPGNLHENLDKLCTKLESKQNSHKLGADKVEHLHTARADKPLKSIAI